MRRRASRRGKTVDRETPDWQPLLDLAPEHRDDFMWMFEVELDNGERVHAFKHYWTRRYLHLDLEGPCVCLQRARSLRGGRPLLVA